MSSAYLDLRRVEPPAPGAVPSWVARDLTVELATALGWGRRLDDAARLAGPVLPPARWADLAIVGSGLASGECISVAEAWRRHDSAMAAWREGRARSTGEGELDLLSLKRQLAYELTRRCRACALRCGARRLAGEAGICGARAPEDARLANVQVVAGEEAFLSPTIAIWLAGCPEQCVGCLYKPLISASRGARFDSGRLASVLAKMAAGGEVTSLMALGGNPDVHLARWLDVLVALAQAGEVPLPFVWNANGQSTRRSLELLDGVVSVYLLDLKFRSEACAKANGAERLALRRVAPVIRQAAAQDVPVVIRLLVRPGHVQCCARPLVNWFGRVAAQFPTVYLEPMGWLPVFDARRHPVQGRVLSPAERAALYSAIKREAIPPERLLLDGSQPMGGV